MQSTHPHGNSISDLATDNGNDATPFAQQSVVLTQQARSVEREAALTAKVASLEATVRDLTQRLYGTKSEKSAGPDEVAESPASRLRHRGQQPGSKGHGRSARSALLMVPEVHDLSPAQLCCPACGEAFAPFPGTEDSTINEASPQQAAGYQTEGHCRGDTTVSPPSSLCKVTSEQAPRNLLIEVQVQD